VDLIDRLEQMASWIDTGVTPEGFSEDEYLPSLDITSLLREAANEIKRLREELRVDGGFYS